MNYCGSISAIILPMLLNIHKVTTAKPPLFPWFISPTMRFNSWVSPTICFILTMLSTDRHLQSPPYESTIQLHLRVEPGVPDLDLLRSRDFQLILSDMRSYQGTSLTPGDKDVKRLVGWSWEHLFQVSKRSSRHVLQIPTSVLLFNRDIFRTSALRHLLPVLAGVALAGNSPHLIEKGADPSRRTGSPEPSHFCD